MPDVFKYNTLISIPLFGLIVYLQIRSLPEFSPSVHTISKSILLLNTPRTRMIFRFNFLLKTLLDFGFYWFLVGRYGLTWKTPLAWTLLAPIVLFGSLAFITEERHHAAHIVIAYAIGTIWAVSQMWLSWMTADSRFFMFTFLASVIPLLIAYFFQIRHAVNIYVQVVCITILYAWLAVFIIWYV